MALKILFLLSSIIIIIIMAFVASADPVANLVGFIQDNGFKFVTVVDLGTGDNTAVKQRLVKDLASITSYVRTMDFKDVW